jgi:hypothetical protein
MRYTQAQVRDLLDIPVETFRTWRETLPALGRHRGHGPTLTPGDIVALAVVAEIVRDYGIKIGTVAARLNEVVETCHGLSWLSLEDQCVLIGTESAKLTAIQRLTTDLAQTKLVVPCRPIIARLRGALSEAEPDGAQGHLQFPPAALSGGKRHG